MRNLKRLFVTLLLSVFAGGIAFAQSSVKVSGVVTSADDGLPMIGVAVMDGMGNGVITSLDGEYEIVVAPGVELTFSSIGFNDEKIIVPQTTAFVHNVVMHPESMKLDDVVVIAYGVRKKGTVAGSVSTVKSEKLESTPTAAFDQALQGQVAGLTVLSNTGEPSASASMKIRGTNSINSGTSPLYILDGVEISASSGCQSTAECGADFIAELVEQAAGRIIVMPGAGIRPSNIAKIEKITRAAEFHSTARKYSPDYAFRSAVVDFSAYPDKEGLLPLSSADVVSQLVNNVL